MDLPWHQLSVNVCYATLLYPSLQAPACGYKSLHSSATLAESRCRDLYIFVQHELVCMSVSESSVSLLWRLNWAINQCHIQFLWELLLYFKHMNEQCLSNMTPNPIFEWLSIFSAGIDLVCIDQYRLCLPGTAVTVDIDCCVRHNQLCQPKEDSVLRKPSNSYMSMVFSAKNCPIGRVYLTINVHDLQNQHYNAFNALIPDIGNNITNWCWCKISSWWTRCAGDQGI